MNTRAKFMCVGNERLADTFEVKLHPVISGSKENRDFFKYTPGGEIRLAVVGGDTASQFLVGHDYYVDFTEVLEADSPVSDVVVKSPEADDE